MRATALLGTLESHRHGKSTRGRFAGQFFGNRDSWASLPDRTQHIRDEVLKLLKGVQIEIMNEEEKDDAPDVRNPKHWHRFHVVEKKN